MSTEASGVKRKPIDVLRKVANNRLAIGLIGTGLLAATVFGRVETDKLMPTIPVPIREGQERYQALSHQAIGLIEENKPNEAATILTSPQFRFAQHNYEEVLSLYGENQPKRILLATTTVCSFFGAGICSVALLHKSLKPKHSL